jgi:hypothetical protein
MFLGPNIERNLCIKTFPPFDTCHRHHHHGGCAIIDTAIFHNWNLNLVCIYPSVTFPQLSRASYKVLKQQYSVQCITSSPLGAGILLLVGAVLGQYDRQPHEDLHNP